MTVTAHVNLANKSNSTQSAESHLDSTTPTYQLLNLQKSSLTR